MKIKKIHTKTLPIVLVLAAVIVSGIAYFIYSATNINKNQVKPENTVNYAPPTDEQKVAGDKAKSDFIARVDNNDQTNSTTSQQGASSATAPAQIVGVRITSVGMNAGYLQIRTIISTIDNAGKCTLKLSRPSSDTISLTADTQVTGSYTVCKGFDIDTTHLAKGDWNAEIKYVGSSNQTGSAIKTVTVQ